MRPLQDILLLPSLLKYLKAGSPYTIVGSCQKPEGHVWQQPLVAQLAQHLQGCSTHAQQRQVLTPGGGRGKGGKGGGA